MLRGLIVEGRGLYDGRVYFMLMIIVSRVGSVRLLRSAAVNCLYSIGMIVSGLVAWSGLLRREVRVLFMRSCQLSLSGHMHAFLILGEL